MTAPLLNLDGIDPLPGRPSCPACKENDWVKFSSCQGRRADCFDAFRYFTFMREDHFHLKCLRCRHEWYAVGEDTPLIYNATLPMCDECGNFPTLARVLLAYACGHHYCTEHEHAACPIHSPVPVVVDPDELELLSAFDGTAKDGIGVIDD